MQISTSETINEIAAACAKAQAELENVAKTGNNPHFRSSYATLPDVLTAVRKPYAAHGVAIWQFATNSDDGAVGVVTRFAHSSGQWIEGALSCKPTKFDAQGVGSVITYLRRYSLMAMAGISGDDDDGNAAVAAPSNGNGHVKLVSSEERQALIKIADEVGADKDKFCDWLGVDSFASIPASQYQKAVAALNSKRQAVAAK
jgi:hypothetical protein